ncbi:hypothetical protein ACK8OR_11565 [Jannaschia sp. KMU-145]|uniref:hypothetical protein n=1 Tax=Jannaschia halovivens TaxID=3388667 RepID=UPI00396AFB14
MALIIAAIFLAAFVTNVVMGSVAGDAPLGNVAEMLLLLTAAVAFTVAILRREADAKAKVRPDDD